MALSVEDESYEVVMELFKKKKTIIYVWAFILLCIHLAFVAFE